jgi:molybdate/tungstate transport system substrate-binding protein
MGALMERSIKPAVATALRADLQGRAQGSGGLANLIIAGSIRPDLFISATEGPMRTVLHSGKVLSAIPIARTEMVIAYSPRSRYAEEFARCRRPGARQWWQVLEARGSVSAALTPIRIPRG